MIKKKKPELRLTDRDATLLLSIWSLGYLKLDQIAKYIFKTNYKNASKRLIKLRDAKLLRFIWRQDYSGTRVYIPDFSDPDNRRLKLYFDVNGAPTNQPWFNKNIEHEDTLRDWALRVDDLMGEGEIVADFALNGDEWNNTSDQCLEKNKKPDFVLNRYNFDDQETYIAFEIELNAKSRLNYYQIFRSIINKPRTVFIYLAKNKTIRDKLRNCYTEVLYAMAEKGERPKHKVFIYEFSELTADAEFLKVLQQAAFILDTELANEKPAELRSQHFVGESAQVIPLKPAR